MGGDLHEISFKNNIKTLVNRSHLQKLGHFERHNDYLVLPLIMTLLLQITSGGSQIIMFGNIHTLYFNKNVKLFFVFKAIFQLINFGGSYLKIEKFANSAFCFSLSYIMKGVVLIGRCPDTTGRPTKSARRTAVSTQT
jgi:hypothetical protein